MSVVLTVPAVEAVLLFQRQECDCDWAPGRWAVRLADTEAAK